MNIRWQLRKRIRDRFPSQTAFAFHLGVSESLVSKVVNGWRNLDRESQRKWAEALGCAPEEIFSDEERQYA